MGIPVAMEEASVDPSVDPSVDAGLPTAVVLPPSALSSVINGGGRVVLVQSSTGTEIGNLNVDVISSPFWKWSASVYSERFGLFSF